MSEKVPKVLSSMRQISGISDFARLRERAGLSVEGLADQIGFSVRTVYRWENGEIPPRKVAVRFLENLVREKHGETPKDTIFKFIDLFAGIGGLRRAFEPLGGKCVFTSEWNRYAQLTYMANYDCDHEITGDITQVPADRIPPHDLLLAGFPCQPFSIAGVSKKNALGQPHGFRCEAQGTLFFDVARIIETHRPSAFLLENVKNLTRHDGGRTFDIIHRTLAEELGYQVHCKLLDSRPWVPQRRERIFIVGFRESNGFTFDDLYLPDPVGGPRLKMVLHPEDGSEMPENPYTAGSEARVSGKYTLSRHMWKYLRNYAAKHRAAGNGFGFGLVGPEDVSRTLSARYHKDGSEILVSRGRRNPRRLTPRECSRLMGFDEPDGKQFTIPVSDTQAYIQFGNAVVVPCARAVAEHMVPWLGIDGDFHSLNRQMRLPLVG